MRTYEVRMHILQGAKHVLLCQINYHVTKYLLNVFLTLGFAKYQKKTFANFHCSH